MNFLERFIKEEKYLQNHPLDTKRFIEFCQKRGIITDEKELEYFEKQELLFPIFRIDRPVGEDDWIKYLAEDGKEYMCPMSEGKQIDGKEIGREKVRFYSSYGFDEHSKDLLSNWVEEGLLFDPSTKPFSPWKNFEGGELRNDKDKIVTFYSSFQVYWLEYLKDILSFSIKPIDENFIISTSFCFFKEEKTINSLNILDIKDALNKKISQLQNKKLDYRKLLYFLLSIQHVYFPYFKSGAKKIQITGDDRKWRQLRRDLKLEDELKYLNISIEDVAHWYYILSEKSQALLGVKNGDWLQLWKNIDWDKKDKLEGRVRLGVDYLQGAVMIKIALEEYRHEEILDVDEMTNIAPHDTLRYKPNEMEQYGTLLRALRNSMYYDPIQKVNYYHDRYKRLYYLSNEFGVDYQPRVLVFVEGKTEMEVFPKVFEWYYEKPESLGIELVNLQGITEFCGPKLNLKDPHNNKYLKVFLSNFNHLISYNLSKWQIIPFLIGDDEGNISILLQKASAVNFEGKQYPFPQKWKFIWGVDNGNVPFVGKDLELANFNDQEITAVLSVVLSKTIREDQVQSLRGSVDGINTIDPDVQSKKVEIANRLFQNLFELYIKMKDDSLLERPIFKVLEKVIKLAALNHQPTNRSIELENKEYIRQELTNS